MLENNTIVIIYAEVWIQLLFRLTVFAVYRTIFDPLIQEPGLIFQYTDGIAH
jgi:hypothetical protein